MVVVSLRPQCREEKRSFLVTPYSDDVAFFVNHPHATAVLRNESSVGFVVVGDGDDDDDDESCHSSRSKDVFCMYVRCWPGNVYSSCFRQHGGHEKRAGAAAKQGAAVETHNRGTESAAAASVSV